MSIIFVNVGYKLIFSDYFQRVRDRFFITAISIVLFVILVTLLL